MVKTCSMPIRFRLLIGAGAVALQISSTHSVWAEPDHSTLVRSVIEGFSQAN